MRIQSLIRMSCLLGVLALCRTSAADQKPALVGATRDEVLSRMGDPTGDIVAGDREVLVFATERVVLRAGRVVEVEEIPQEPPPPAPSEPAAQSAAGGTPQNTPSVAAAGAGIAAAAPTPSASAPADDEAQPTPSTSAPVRSEPEVVIKAVRPPSAFARRRPAAVAAAAKPAPASSGVKPPVGPQPAEPAPAATAAAPVSSASTAPVYAPAKTNAVAGAAALAPASEATKLENPAAPSTPAARTSAAVATAAPAATPNATDGVFTARTYAISLVIIVGGIGYLIWRRRNRQLMLAATAVSNSPFPAQPILANGARFTQELLAQLEWKRFEELVAAYYNKTGVQATRTKSGPTAPVHVRISWKGEQRPFALVQCIAKPPALIDARPVQALCDVLATEDIRRGYIVSSGKFGIAARDLAEEKHVTLLPGEIFLEKLNALPDSVRAELIHETTKGDYSTPTCPKCDVKMVHPAGNPDGWQCPQCGAVLPPV